MYIHGVLVTLLIFSLAEKTWGIMKDLHPQRKRRIMPMSPYVALVIHKLTHPRDKVRIIKLGKGEYQQTVLQIAPYHKEFKNQF